MFFACVGTRDLNGTQRQALEQLGALIVYSGHYLSSGNAQGSDQAFAAGASQISSAHVFLHLPWRNYEAQAIVAGNQVHSLEDLAPDLYQQYENLAAQSHPAWDRCKQGARKLHMRNGCILFSPLLNRRVDAVLALPSQKQGGGGTGQAMRLAQKFGIPLYDLSLLKQDQWQELMALIQNGNKG